MHLPLKTEIAIYGCSDLTFGDGADDFVGSFVAFGTGAAGRRERTNKIVSTIAKSQILQLSNQRNSDPCRKFHQENFRELSEIRDEILVYDMFSSEF